MLEKRRVPRDEVRGVDSWHFQIALSRSCVSAQASHWFCRLNLCRRAPHHRGAWWQGRNTLHHCLRRDLSNHPGSRQMQSSLTRNRHKLHLGHKWPDDACGLGCHRLQLINMVIQMCIQNLKPLTVVEIPIVPQQYSEAVYEEVRIIYHSAYCWPVGAHAGTLYNPFSHMRNPTIMVADALT